MFKLGNLIYQSSWSLQQICSCTTLSSSASCAFFSFPSHRRGVHCSLLHFRPLPLPDCLFAFLPPPSPSPSRFLHSSHFVSFPLFFISSPSLLSLITFLTIIFPVCPAPFPVPSYSFTILNLFPCHYLPYLFLPVYRLSLPSTLLLPSLLPPFRFLSFFLASNLLPFLFCFPPFS